jgi:hypothetical protein
MLLKCVEQQHQLLQAKCGIASGHTAKSFTGCAGVQVVDSMPDMASLKAAAGAQQLDLKSLLGAKMCRTAVALLCKSSGKRACDDVVS